MATNEETRSVRMQRTSAALQAACTQLESNRCFVIADPSVRDLSKIQMAGRRLVECNKAVVAIQHEQFPKDHRPYLIELAVDSYKDLLLLDETILAALDDRDPDSMARGHGQRIGGWLISKHPIDVVSRHLSKLILQQDEHGKRCAVRIHDSRVLALLWRELRNEQKEALLGPVDAWCALDIKPELATHAMGSRNNSSFKLSDKQWPTIDLIGVVNAALAQYARSGEHEITDESAILAMKAAHRAVSHGITDEKDQTVFIGHALAWHPQFDSHPAVQSALQEVAKGEYYAAVIENISAVEIDEIRHGSWLKTAQGV